MLQTYEMEKNSQNWGLKQNHEIVGITNCEIWNVGIPCTTTPWLPRICFTKISLTQLFKKNPDIQVDPKGSEHFLKSGCGIQMSQATPTKFSMLFKHNYSKLFWKFGDHSFNFSFVHGPSYTQPFRTLFLFKSIWTHSQGSRWCQKIRFYFSKMKVLIFCTKIAPERHKLRKTIKIGIFFQKIPVSLDFFEYSSIWRQY